MFADPFSGPGPDRSRDGRLSEPQCEDSSLPGPPPKTQAPNHGSVMSILSIPRRRISPPTRRSNWTRAGSASHKLLSFFPSRNQGEVASSLATRDLLVSLGFCFWRREGRFAVPSFWLLSIAFPPPAIQAVSLERLDGEMGPPLVGTRCGRDSFFRTGRPVACVLRGNKADITLVDYQPPLSRVSTLFFPPHYR